MISIIVVLGKSRQIGFQNRLLWKLPKDMQRFRRITLNKTVIMGDKTFESIGQLLAQRENIVLSLAENYQAAGCRVENSLEQLVEKYQNSTEEVFVIGGGTIYRLFLPFAQKLYLTLIDDDPEADTYFPDYSAFSHRVKREEGIDNGFKFQYLELTK